MDWKLIEYGHSNWQDGQVPGVDGMGTIVALGANVSHLRPGARVAYHTDLRHHGSFARHTRVPARALLPVPDALSDEAAAALPCPGLTAWQALAKLPRLHGKRCLSQVPAAVSAALRCNWPSSKERESLPAPAHATISGSNRLVCRV